MIQFNHHFVDGSKGQFSQFLLLRGSFYSSLYNCRVQIVDIFLSLYEHYQEPTFSGNRVEQSKVESEGFQTFTMQLSSHQLRGSYK